jgi:hypothetical protein
MWEGTISELHKNIKYFVLDYVLESTHHKLNFGVHRLKT